jgi:GNAT superfamily N-acetyltransferase
VGRLPFTLRQAVPADVDVVLQLAREAAQWLRGKDTDQWARPWPDPERREQRIQRDIAAGKTWILWDDMTGTATVTVDKQDTIALAGHRVWPEHRLAEPALYVRRMIVRRSYAGLDLGAGLLDWATSVATRELGTALLRIDVWTDNRGLHAYYEGQGFTLCEIRDPAELPDYPARALFERRINPNGHSRVGVVLTDSVLIGSEVRTEVPGPRLPL